MLVTDSATESLAVAAASKTALGVLSPIDMASPDLPVKPEAVIAWSATGTCQGPTN